MSSTTAPLLPPAPFEIVVGLHHATLRDYFAAAALVGIAANMTSEARRRYRDGTAAGDEAAVAYSLADAMLRERVL